MARPKLPIALRKVRTMNVRVRLDLDQGLAAVALLRGSTKSGIVSQYAAEQVRLEWERNETSFAAALKEIRAREAARRRKKSALSRVERISDSPDSLKVTTENTRKGSLERSVSGHPDRTIDPLSNGGQTYIPVALGSPSLLARRTKDSCADPETHSSGINLAPELPE